MIDALLQAVLDEVLGASLGYDAATFGIQPDGHPPPRMGNVYGALHEGATRSLMDNALDEYFGFSITLTMIVKAPLDRVGDTQLARKLARQKQPGGAPSFNARVEQLRSLLHMDWGLLQAANTYLTQWASDEVTVYGFAEPARYRGCEQPHLEGGAWLVADPAAENTCLVAEMRFEDARRLQAIGFYT